jgi:hypothetical protein
MNKVELQFAYKAFKRGGIRMYSKQDAIQFVEECRQHGIPILGIDGFYIDQKTTQPSMDNSIDLSIRIPTGDIYDISIEFLKLRDDDLWFEIVCGVT